MNGDVCHVFVLLRLHKVKFTASLASYSRTMDSGQTKLIRKMLLQYQLMTAKMMTCTRTLYYVNSDSQSDADELVGRLASDSETEFDVF